MKYYVQYKRLAEPFYRTYGSLNSAREVMDVLRTGRQRDSNLHYIWARYQRPSDIVTNPEGQSSLLAVRSLGPEITQQPGPQSIRCCCARPRIILPKPPSLAMAGATCQV